MTQEDHLTAPVWQTRITTKGGFDADTANRIADCFEDDPNINAVHMSNLDPSDGNEWVVDIMTFEKLDAAALANVIQQITSVDVALTTERIPETDWLSQVHQNFPPLITNRFFIYGSHYDGAFPEDRIALQIDAATAFGSGEHATTQGCLEALEDLHTQDMHFENLLDMGCGSGILALAARKLWPGITATCVDIDPESVIVTERHATLNKEQDIKTAAGDGYATPIAGEHQPYDLICANILSGPLIDMAPDLAAHLAPSGYAILSGLLSRQIDKVTQAHKASGLTIVKTHTLENWGILVLQKPA